MPIEKIAPNLFRIIVPLPLQDVDSMNVYIITDPDRNLIVDSGMAHRLCHDAMKVALKELDLNLQRTDFFITHHHLDHYCLAPLLMPENSIIYINPTEADSIHDITTGDTSDDLIRLFEVMGFIEKDAMKVVSFMTGDEYKTKKPFSFRQVKGGEIIRRGGYRFQCMVTPGHSRAHTCLHEPDRKILLSGDALSPVIQFVTDRGDPLGDHLKSLNRLRRMKIDLVLPGHHSPFRNIRERIDSLKAHHEKKLNAVLNVLTDADQTVYQIARKIGKGRNAGENWDMLNVLKKFFLVRDCFTHLKHLHTENRILQDRSGQQLVYRRKTF